jgi:hypothetical protein
VNGTSTTELPMAADTPSVLWREKTSRTDGAIALLLASAATVAGAQTAIGGNISTDGSATIVTVGTTATALAAPIDVAGGYGQFSDWKSKPAARQVERFFSDCRTVLDDDEGRPAAAERLREILRLYGDYAVNAMYSAIAAGRVPNDAAADTLRLLGVIEDEGSRDARWWLLTAALQFASVKVRDGALVGLTQMPEKRTIPYLRAAAAREQHSWLQGEMKRVLGRLQNRAVDVAIPTAH